MRMYARVKEELRFGELCEWKEVKKEVRQMNRNRLVFTDGEVRDAFVYDVIYVF